MPKWSRKRRAYAGLMVASRRDKAMRSWSLNLLDAFVPSEVDSFRFFYCCMAYCTVYNLLQYILFKRFEAGSSIRTFAWDVKSKLKMMLKVDNCMPQMSEPCWSTDCGSYRIPGYVSTSSSLVVDVNMSTNSGSIGGSTTQNTCAIGTDV